MEKIALIGATGFVGTAILHELLERGFTVTAIARDVAEIKAAENVVAVQVDVNDATALKAALIGNEAVISAFNAGWTNPNIYEDYIAGGRAVLMAIKESGIKRIIVVGGAGSLTIKGERLVDTKDFPKDIKAGALAAADYLEIVKREPDLDWTFFSPAIMMSQENSGKRSGNYRIGTEEPIFDTDGQSKLTVEDAAVAIVDELANAKYVKQRFTAGY